MRKATPDKAQTDAEVETLSVAQAMQAIKYHSASPIQVYSALTGQAVKYFATTDMDQLKHIFRVLELNEEQWNVVAKLQELIQDKVGDRFVDQKLQKQKKDRRQFLAKFYGEKGQQKDKGDAPPVVSRNYLTGAGSKGVYTDRFLPIADAGPIKSVINKSQSLVQNMNLERFNNPKLPKGARQKGYLQSFPAWVLRQSTQTTKLSDMSDLRNTVVNNMNVQQYQPFDTLAALNPDLAYWDAKSSSWKGTQVDRIKKLTNNAPFNYAAKFQKSSALYNTHLTAEQVQTQVPAFIKQIVAANDALSSVGFGPVSANGAALYAGRWLDKASGNIRVLPGANSRYLNPISASQKLGYLQAKMLNHWNNLVSTAEQYYKLSQPQAQVKYVSRAQNSIKNGLNPEKIKKSAAQKIQATIIKIIQGRQFGLSDMGMGKYKAIILKYASDDMLTGIYNLNDDQMEIAWNQACFSGYTAALQTVTGGRSVQGIQQAAKLSRAYLDLIGSQNAKVRNSLKKLVKSRLVPEDATMNQMMNIVEDIDTASSTIDKRLATTVINKKGGWGFVNAVKGTDDALYFSPHANKDLMTGLNAKDKMDVQYSNRLPKYYEAMPVRASAMDWVSTQVNKKVPLVKSIQDRLQLTPDGRQLLGLNAVKSLGLSRKVDGTKVEGGSGSGSGSGS